MYIYLQRLQGNGIVFEQRYYDNVASQRRGVTSLAWLKPKLKLQFGGRPFRWRATTPGAAPTALSAHKVDLQPFFDEIGENRREGSGWKGCKGWGRRVGWQGWMDEVRAWAA